jgi:thiol:disulfide interchange protein DsbD
LIPITVSYFSGAKGQSYLVTITNSLLYLLGLAITNSFLGVWAALSGRMVGSALQNPWVVLFLAALFIALALSSFGFWELRLPSLLTRSASKTFRGYFGTFFMGLTMGIIAAPCLGPFVIGLLAYVHKRVILFLPLLFILSPAWFSATRPFSGQRHVPVSGG